MEVNASIVSIGSWNPRIFTPSWVSNNVFSLPEGESMNISLNERQMNLAYIWKDIQLLIVDRGIELKTDKVNMGTLEKMEGIYSHLSEMLSYTPVTAIGFNINLLLTKEEYAATVAAGMARPFPVGVYTCQSQTFSASIDGAIRSFEVRPATGNTEIRCNFHYATPRNLPMGGSVFKTIISELKHFLGYELSI